MQHSERVHVACVHACVCVCVCVFLCVCECVLGGEGSWCLLAQLWE